MLEFLDRQPGFADQASQDSGAQFTMEWHSQNDGFTRLNQADMAAALPILHPTSAFEGPNRLFPRADRQFHGETATSTSATSMLAGRSCAFRVSRLSKIASRMFSSASSRVRPWERQPGKAGQSATQ